LALSERQAKGCLREIENERLRRTIVEYFPLPPAIAYFLQMGSYDITGYFDLTPDFRMQITSPIYPAGTEPSTKTLLGYETANYTFVREGPDNRTRLRLASATEVLIGAAPIETTDSAQRIAFFRLSGALSVGIHGG
jgi:hypothetical protein